MSAENEDLKPLSLDDNNEPLKPLSFENKGGGTADEYVPISQGNSSEIKNKDSNFVFFFGTAESGKSVILSS